MSDTTSQADREQRLLDDIGKLADRVRTLRATPGVIDSPGIKALEDQSRSKWQELRTLRAGPAAANAPSYGSTGRGRWQ